MTSRTRAARIAALATAAVALAMPAAAAAQTTEQPKPKFYFKCDETAKVQNPTLATGAPRTWSDKAPTASFTTGAGCGFLDSPLTGTGPSTVYDGVFGGTFDGAFIAAKVELHNLVLGQAAWTAFIPRVIARLTVDGTEVKKETFDVTPVLSTSGLTQSVTFEFKKLNVPKTIGGREIILTVDSIGSAWVFDASEVPASIEFTPPPPPLAPATS